MILRTQRDIEIESHARAIFFAEIKNDMTNVTAFHALVGMIG